MAEGILDVLEALGYFTAFWIFIFSRKYRKALLESFVNSGWLRRAEMVLEAIGSVICGLILPSALIYGLVLLIFGD